MSMGQHSGLRSMALALGLGMAAMAGNGIMAEAAPNHREIETDFYSGNGRYRKGSHCQRRTNPEARRRKRKAQRKARIAAAHARRK